MGTAARIHAATWGTDRIPGCTGYVIDAGRETKLTGGSGAQYPRLASAGRYVQGVALTTQALGVILPKLGTSGTTPVPAASLSGQTLVIAEAIQDDVLPTLETNGELLTIPLGMIALTGLSWSEVGQGIDADLRVYPLSSDGDAAPWTATSATLPGLATNEEAYDVAGITWAGSALVGATGLRMSFDTRPEPRHNPGKIYPSYIRQAPATGLLVLTAEVTVPTRNLLRTYGAHFAGGAVGNLVVTCRPFAQAASRGALTVTITLAGVAEVVQSAAGLPGQTTLRITGVSTGGVTSPLSWSGPV